MAPDSNKWTRKMTQVFSRKTITVPPEPSSSSAPARAISNTGDVDAHDSDGDSDNKSALSTGTYIITNVGRKMRAALCSPNDEEGVVASLDGTNVIPEAGDEWILTHHGGDSMYRIQNKRYQSYAGSMYRPPQNSPVECADFHKSYLWRIRHFDGKHMIENAATNVCWHLADSELQSPVQLTGCSTDPSKSWNFQRLGSVPILTLTPSTDHDIGPVNKNTERPQNTVIERVYGWLRAVIPSASYRRALEQRLEGTGLWFIDSEIFREWKTTPGSFCWVHGPPGTGKTVLSAGIIKAIISNSHSDQPITCAYFFFDDGCKQLGGLVRSLIKQFAVKGSADLEPLITLYKHCNDTGSEPSIESLWDILLGILNSFLNPYIIIDALDQCSEREKVLDQIKVMINLKKRSLHLLVTSRDDEDIAVRLRTFDPFHVPLQPTLVNRDIEQYIDVNLKCSSKFARRDPREIATIKKQLMEKAEGMFQWVSLQIKEIQEDHNISAIEDKLKCLPPELSGVYDRIIARIHKKNLANVHKILQWLCFSFEPLKLNQVAEVVGVIPDQKIGLHFEPSHVYQDPTSVLGVCSSLVKLVNETVMLSHMSVKDYLLTRTHEHDSYPLVINKKLAHSLIAQTCLAYLLQFTDLTMLDKMNIQDFPLAYYVAQYWMMHVHSGPPKPPKVLLELIETLFQLPHSSPFIAWIGIWNADEPLWQAKDAPCKCKEPLYYASLTGMECVLPFLLKQDANVNALGGRYGYALQAASCQGYEAVIRILLKNGARVNALGGYYGNALQAASYGGHKAIVEILINMGANVNAWGGHFHTALQAASYRGHGAIVKILLKNGANVNKQGGRYGNALQAASCQGHDTVVMALLKNGADIDAPGGFYGNAFQAASDGGHQLIIKILLEKRADANA